MPGRTRACRHGDRARRAHRGRARDLDLRGVPRGPLRQRDGHRDRGQPDRPLGERADLPAGRRGLLGLRDLLRDSRVHPSAGHPHRATPWARTGSSARPGRWPSPSTATQLANPFRDASFVYVPYCTGDIYGGEAVQTYTSGQTSKTVHHMGRANVKAFLSRLVPTFPGSGAGVADRGQRRRLRGDGQLGAGARVLRGRARGRGERLRCAHRLRSLALPGHEGLLEPDHPGRLPDCEDSIAALLPYYATRITSPSRYGFLSFREDNVIAGLGSPTASAASELRHVRDVDRRRARARRARTRRPSS